jgi:hypothetical protein
MKLQKHSSRKSKKGDDYFKYEVILTKDLVEKSELKEGDELEGEATKHHITLKKKL